MRVQGVDNRAAKEERWGSKRARSARGSERAPASAITTNSCRRITLWCGRDRTSTGSWARAVQHGRTLSRRHLDSLQPMMTAPEPERKTRQLRGAPGALAPAQSRAKTVSKNKA